MDKLQCDESNHLCICASGYRYDSNRNDCVWFYFCEENQIYDTVRRTCVKSTDFWFPSSNHNPKLSFITFILLVFCFIKVMRSNSPLNERRRRISANTNRNNFDLLSTIINYENNTRYPIRSQDSRHATRAGQHLRRNDEENHPEMIYDESPPPYSEVICADDLKQVTVDQTTNGNLTNENIELKEFYQQDRDKELTPMINQQQQNEQLTANNNQLNNVNQIENSELASNSLENSQENVNNNNLANGDTRPATINHQVNHNLNDDYSNSSNNQHDNQQNNNQQNNNQSTDQLNSESNQSNLQLNQSTNNELPPSYDQAISSQTRRANR